MKRNTIRGVGGCIGVALWLAALAGCATLTFKRGASPGDMAAAETACRSENPEEAAYVECMRNRGWFVTGSGTAPDAAVTPGAAPEAPAGAPGAPAADEAPAPANAPSAVPAEPHMPSAAAPALPGATAAPVVEGKPAVTPAAPADPLARVEVGSWWKVLGGSPADLDRAIDTCVATLGPAYRPEPGATVVTEGLRACMRAAGWYSLKGSSVR